MCYRHLTHISASVCFEIYCALRNLLQKQNDVQNGIINSRICQLYCCQIQCRKWKSCIESSHQQTLIIWKGWDLSSSNWIENWKWNGRLFQITFISHSESRAFLDLDESVRSCWKDWSENSISVLIFKTEIIIQRNKRFQAEWPMVVEEKIVIGIYLQVIESLLYTFSCCYKWIKSFQCNIQICINEVNIDE